MRFYVTIILTLLTIKTVVAQSDKESFYTYCGPCHTIGNGKLVGPDLKDVQKKYGDEQLISWVKSVQANQRIAADSLLILAKLHPERKMDSFSYMKNQDIMEIINYIKKVSAFNWIGPIPDKPEARHLLPDYPSKIDTTISRRKPIESSSHMHNLEFFWYFHH